MKNLLYNIFKLIKEFLSKQAAKPKEEVTKPIEVSPANPEEILKKLLWYPGAIIPEKRMATSGDYQYGYPQGAIVHFTAGQDRTEQDALDSYDWGRGEGYVFFVIGPTGVVYQGFPLNKYGSHAGKSHWEGLGDRVSSKLVGIEIACAGLLNGSGYSWFDKLYPEEQTRRVGKEHECMPGQYKKYTDKQEAALIDLLKWLHQNNPEVFKVEYILGHDEVAGVKGIGYYRKNDPGGSLSIPMRKLRELVKG